MSAKSRWTKQETHGQPPKEQRLDGTRTGINCRVTYSYEEGVTYISDGLLWDVSEVGCGIRGQCPPPVGSRISLTLYLLDRNPPLPLLNAHVTWVAGETFGVKFPSLTAKEYERVRRHMRNALSRSGSRGSAERAEAWSPT